MAGPGRPRTALASLLGGVQEIYVDGVQRPMRAAWNLIGATVVEDSVNKRLDVSFPSSGVTLADSIPQPVGEAAVGVSGQAAREDHVHAHGNQSGGGDHAIATTSTHGFMSKTDKDKLDSIDAAVLTSQRTWKASVRAVRTGGAIPGYADGVIEFTGATILDAEDWGGVTLVAGDRVLISQQTNTEENGIYTFDGYVIEVGGSFTRASDCDADADVTPGMVVLVTEGDPGYGGTLWRLTSPTSGTIQIGTTGLEWEKLVGGVVDVDPTPDTVAVRTADGAGLFTEVAGADAADFGVRGAASIVVRHGDAGEATDLFVIDRDLTIGGTDFTGWATIEIDSGLTGAVWSGASIYVRGTTAVGFASPLHVWQDASFNETARMSVSSNVTVLDFKGSSGGEVKSTSGNLTLSAPSGGQIHFKEGSTTLGILYETATQAFWDFATTTVFVRAADLRLQGTVGGQAALADGSGNYRFVGNVNGPVIGHGAGTSGQNNATKFIGIGTIPTAAPPADSGYLFYGTAVNNFVVWTETGVSKEIGCADTATGATSKRIYDRMCRVTTTSATTTNTTIVAAADLPTGDWTALITAEFGAIEGGNIAMAKQIHYAARLSGTSGIADSVPLGDFDEVTGGVDLGLDFDSGTLRFVLTTNTTNTIKAWCRVQITLVEAG